MFIHSRGAFPTDKAPESSALKLSRAFGGHYPYPQRTHTLRLWAQRPCCIWVLAILMLRVRETDIFLRIPFPRRRELNMLVIRLE